MEILTGHTSPETAYIMERLSSTGKPFKGRYWIEYNPEKGFRFMHEAALQTEEGEVWIDLRKSDWHALGAVMEKYDTGAVNYRWLDENAEYEDAYWFLKVFKHCLPKSASERLEQWVANKKVERLALVEQRHLTPDRVKEIIEHHAPPWVVEDERQHQAFAEGFCEGKSNQ